jgi:hypothetical protein
MARQKLPPWRGRCSYIYPNQETCKSVSPRDHSHCVIHSRKAGEALEAEAGTVVRELELPALGLAISELDSAHWEAVRLRLIRTQPGVRL